MPGVGAVANANERERGRPERTGHVTGLPVEREGSGDPSPITAIKDTLAGVFALAVARETTPLAAARELARRRLDAALRN